MATGNHQSVESVKSHLNALEKSPSRSAASSPIAHGRQEGHHGAGSGQKNTKSFKEKGGAKRGKGHSYIKT